MSFPLGRSDVTIARWAFQETPKKVRLVAMQFRLDYADGSYETITKRSGVDPDKAVYDDGTTQLELAYRDLRACGWEGTNLFELNKIDPAPCGVTIDVSYSKSVNKDTGLPYYDIKIVDDDPRRSAMSDEDAAFVGAQLQSFIVEMDTRSGRKASKRPPPAPRVRPAAAAGENASTPTPPAAAAARGRPSFSNGAGAPADFGPTPMRQPGDDDDIPNL